MSESGKRFFGAIGCGLLAGALLTTLIALPLHVFTEKARATNAIRQENLVNACGEAYDAFDLAEASFTVLLDGAPHGGTALFAAEYGWVTPQGGELSLPLAPNLYTFLAVHENRTVSLESEVLIGAENSFVLDVGNAPSAPDLLMFEAAEGETAVFPLEISGAAEVTLESDMNGVLLVRQRGAYFLSVDSGVLGFGFHHLIVRAENEAGSAVTHVGLRVPRDVPVTPVYTVADLNNIRRNLSGHYLLMNDIDMSEIHNWTPIGGKYPFTGIFDGGGHEITGFHAPEELESGAVFSLLGVAEHAEIRNVIVREPGITPNAPDRDMAAVFSCAVIANSLTQSLMENCASIGGAVRPEGSGNVSGAIGGANYSIVRGVFNSTDVYCSMANHYLPNVGGVSGTANYSYVAGCANEGEVKGNHLTGGIVGFGYQAQLRRCVNSGFIWGSTFLGRIPAGGINQTFEGAIAYGYYVRSQSAIGARAYEHGKTVSLVPITWEELRRAEALPLLGSFDGEAPMWAYASLDAAGPVPYGIFQKQADPPILPEAGSRVALPAIEGVRYFYALDGDPYTDCAEGVETADITLAKGEVLTVFAARQGYRDSEVLNYSAEGGK